MTNRKNNVIYAALKLSRAMRRCPPERGEFPFPPAVGRLLECAAENPGVSSRELCEALDVRPSSLSEMLTRAEETGLLTRSADEADRRIQRITLTARGRQAVQEMENLREKDTEKKTSCLTEEEKIQFCALCNRLSEHLESLALDLPEGMEPRHRGPGGPRRHPGPGPEHEGPRPRPEFPEEDGRPPIPPEARFRC